MYNNYIITFLNGLYLTLYGDVLSTKYPFYLFFLICAGGDDPAGRQHAGQVRSSHGHGGEGQRHPAPPSPPHRRPAPEYCSR